MQATWSRQRAKRGEATRCGWGAMRSILWMRCRWTPTQWSTCLTSIPRWDPIKPPAWEIASEVEDMLELQLTGATTEGSGHVQAEPGIVG